jgi:hypothetical protein
MAAKASRTATKVRTGARARLLQATAHEFRVQSTTPQYQDHELARMLQDGQVRLEERPQPGRALGQTRIASTDGRTLGRAYRFEAVEDQTVILHLDS